MATIKYNPHSPSEYTVNGRTYRNLEAQVLANTVALANQASEEVIEELTNRVSALEDTTADLSDDVVELSALGLSTLGIIDSPVDSDFNDLNKAAYFNKFCSLTAAAVSSISHVPTASYGGVLISFSNTDNAEGTVDSLTYTTQLFFASNGSVYYRKGTINTPSTVSFSAWTQLNAPLTITIDGNLPVVYDGSAATSITFTNGNIIYY